MVSRFVTRTLAVTAVAAAVAAPLLASAGVASAQPGNGPLIHTTCSYDQLYAAIRTEAPRAATALDERPAAQQKLRDFAAMPVEQRQQELSRLLAENPQLTLLSDEVYEYITFEQKHISAHTRALLQQRSIIVSSFGKTFHITGWKIGYLIAPAHLLDEIKKVHQYLVFCVNSVASPHLPNT